MKSQSKSTAASMAAFAVILLAVLIVPSSSKPDDTDITCGTIAHGLGPCHAFLQSESDKPATACCDGAISLVERCNTTALRQTACTCLKKLANSFKVEASRAQGLPGNCSFIFEIPIVEDIDCSTVP